MIGVVYTAIVLLLSSRSFAVLGLVVQLGCGGGTSFGADLARHLAQQANEMNAAKERERSFAHRPTTSGAYAIVAIRGDETTADLRRAGLTESFLRSLAAAPGDDTLVVEYERLLSDCVAHREPAIAVLTQNNLECGQPARFPTITRTLVASKSAGAETEIVLRRLGEGVELAALK